MLAAAGATGAGNREQDSIESNMGTIQVESSKRSQRSLADMKLPNISSPWFFRT